MFFSPMHVAPTTENVKSANVGVTMQAVINHSRFRFPLYRAEIRMVERAAREKLLKTMDSAGFVATFDASRNGFLLSTTRGSTPSFCGAGGFLGMDDAQRIFSRQSDSYLR